MKLRTLFMTMLFVMMGTYAFAMAAVQAAAPAAAPAVAASTSTTSAILLAALNGALIGFMGWLSQRKSADGSHETFDPVQLVVTIVIGAGVGAVAAWRKKSFGDVETWIENSGYVTLAEIALKAVWRNGSLHLANVLATLKSGSATNPTVPAVPAPDPASVPPKP